MRYHHFVAELLQVLLEREPHDRFGEWSVKELAPRFGVDPDTMSNGPYERDGFVNAVRCAMTDLAEEDLAVNAGHDWHIGASPAAREYRARPVTELYPAMRAAHLEADEDALLRALALRSERSHERWAEVVDADAETLYGDLGWTDYSIPSLAGLTQALRRARYVAGGITGAGPLSMRIRWRGMVRVADEPTAILAEASEHFRRNRFRAAGCMAGVELERRLKDLCVEGQIPVVPKLPTLSDYNDALWGEKKYPKTTWRRIQHLTDLRNLCAHVLDREPSADDARDLLDGVEDLLRQL